MSTNQIANGQSRSPNSSSQISSRPEDHIITPAKPIEFQKSYHSVNFHPVRRRSRCRQLSIHAGFHLGRVRCAGASKSLFVVVEGRGLGDIRLEAFVVVVRTETSIANGEEDENDGQDGERGELLSSRDIRSFMGRRVHANHLEDEVCQPTKVEDLSSSQNRVKKVLDLCNSQ